MMKKMMRLLLILSLLVLAAACTDNGGEHAGNPFAGSLENGGTYRPISDGSEIGFKGEYAFEGLADAAAADDTAGGNDLDAAIGGVKYGISADAEYLLLVTAFRAEAVLADSDNDYIVGYEIDGADALCGQGKEYFESLQFDAAGDIYTAEDLFGADYAEHFLNVYEVEEYDAAKDYAVRPFLKQIAPEGEEGYTAVKEASGALAKIHTHSLQHVAAQAATCTAEGNTEYWYCKTCKKYYSDQAGTTETTLADTVIGKSAHDMEYHAAQAATCTAEGNKEYWYCKTCKKYYSDQAGATEIALADTVIGKSAHDMEYHAAQAATCTAEGNKEYWYCKTCKKYYSDEAGTTEIALADTVIGKTAHDMEHHAAQAATCTAEGNKEYWYCETCKKYYSDQAGATETTLEAVTINASGHKKGDTLQSDETGHWYPCTNPNCTAQLEKAAHTFDDGVDYSETQSAFTCTVCDYVKHDNYVTGEVSGTLSRTDEVDFTDFVVVMFNEKYSYLFPDAVDSEGTFTIDARIGGEYNVLVCSADGYCGISDEPITVAKTGNAEIRIAVAAGDAVGSVLVNGTRVKTYGNLTPELIEQYRRDGYLNADYETISDIASATAGRVNYMLPIASRVKTGEFSFEAKLEATNCYGYVGVAVTDGTLFVQIDVPTQANIENGATFVRAGTFTDTGWEIGFTVKLITGGVEKQAATDFLARPAIRLADGQFKLYMGSVCFATLSAESGMQLAEGVQLASGDAAGLKNDVYGELFAGFMAEGREYAFLYTSLDGMAGSLHYSFEFKEYADVSGKLVLPAESGAAVQNTRLVIKDNAAQTYATYRDIFDAEGNFAFELAAGSYEFLFSNPASLTKSLSVTLPENAALGNVALEQKDLATNSVIINNSEIRFGQNTGEFTDRLTMDLSKTADYIFNNTVSAGEAVYRGTLRADGGYASIGVGITDGSNAIRIVMQKSAVNSILLEYEQITPDKTGKYPSDYRSYVLSGSTLPCLNYGKTSLTDNGEAVDLNFYFHKKADGSIEIYFEELLLVTVRADGFYLEAEGISATTTEGKLYNPSSGTNKPDASFVQPGGEYAVYASSVGDEGSAYAAAGVEVKQA